MEASDLLQVPAHSGSKMSWAKVFFCMSSVLFVFFFLLHVTHT